MDRRAPRLHAALLCLIMALVLLAWVVGPPATQIIPLLLLICCFHFVDLGWGRASYCPLVRSVRTCMPYIAKPPQPIDPAPHVRMARWLMLPTLLLWIGMFPIPSSLLLLVMALAAALMVLFGVQAATGKHLLRLPEGPADS